MKNKVNNFHCMCEAWFIWGAFLWLMAATYLCVDVLTLPVEHEHMFRIAPLYLLAIGFTLYMVVLLNDGRIVKNRSSFVFSLYSISIVVMLLLYENSIVTTTALVPFAIGATFLFTMMWMLLAHQKMVEERGYYWYVIGSVVSSATFVITSEFIYHDHAGSVASILVQAMSIVVFIVVHAFYAWHAHMNLNTRPETVLSRYLNIFAVGAGGTAVFIMKMLYANRVILDPLYSVIALVVGTVALGTLAASRYIKGREDYDPIDDEGIP